MANRNRQVAIGVNFWLSNEEIKSLRSALEKLHAEGKGHAVIFTAKEKEAVSKWDTFFSDALKSINGEEESVRILPDGD